MAHSIHQGNLSSVEKEKVRLKMNIIYDYYRL